MTAPCPSALADELAAALDGAASDLASELDRRGLALWRAARFAQVDAKTLRLFLSRERQSLAMSTLLRVCLANGIPVEVRIGDAAKPRRKKSARRKRKTS